MIAGVIERPPFPGPFFRPFPVDLPRIRKTADAHVLRLAPETERLARWHFSKRYPARQQTQETTPE